MKKINLFTLYLFVLGGILLSSCNNASTPKASLKSETDSISYAYGVTLADQGLMQHLEQLGVIKSSSDLEQEYQFKIASADSTEVEDLQKELESKMKALKKENAPKLNAFLKGLKEAIDSKEEDSPYIQGLSIGNQLANQMIPQFSTAVFADDSTKKVNTTQLLSGMFSILKNEKVAIDKMESERYVQNKIESAQEEAMRKRDEELKTEYKDTIEEADKFMKENAKKEEVVSLPSGLQYEIIKKGSGETPTADDRVKVHYHGTLLDGTVFDSSVDRGEPTVFGVSHVIPGWTEALKLMPVGSKWKLYIPYDLAYGSDDRGTIKPFSTLIFEVELLGIEE